MALLLFHILFFMHLGPNFIDFMLHPQETFVKLERDTPDKKAGPVAALKR